MRKKSIRHVVSYYKKKYDTSDPFEIARQLNIQLQIGPMNTYSGCYMFLKNHRCIFLNENLDPHEKALVMAHELGHAILHRRENCYFIRSKTYLLTSKIENEANKFAMELLISDDDIQENRYLTIDQMARLWGYHKNLIELRMK